MSHRQIDPLTALEPDFESVDSALFAILGLISLAERTRRTMSSSGSREQAANGRSRSDIEECEAEMPSLPLDALLGAISLSDQLLAQATTTFPALANPCVQPARSEATASKAPAATASAAPNGSLLR